MSKTIWKYQIETIDEQTILMPQDAEILCVQMQLGQPCLWVLVAPSSYNNVRRQIYVHGTGHPVENPDKKKYIGTYQMMRETLVFHVFEGI